MPRPRVRTHAPIGGLDGAPARAGDPPSPVRGPIALLVAAIALIIALCALTSLIGADSQWLAALGHAIVARHGIPDGVPFAAAPSAGWPNPLALAELIFYGLEQAAGARGLMLAQLLAVAIATCALASDSLRAGARADGAALALLIAAAGAFTSLAIVRAQLFSLALFPILTMLLRSEARHPSRRVWIVVPLLALWANLHGAALIGLALTLAYLLLERARRDPWTALAVAVAAVAALWLTPALGHTASYYHGVLTNLAAQRGEGLWTPLRLSEPFDDVALIAAAFLAWRALRSRPRIWEVAVIFSLLVLGVRTGRSMVWLLFFLVAPAAGTFAPRRPWSGLLAPAVLIALGAVAFALVRGPSSSRGENALVARTVMLAHGTPVLAPDRLAERVALQGGRIWIGNPLDAFSAADQGAYLDFLDGRPRGLAALVPQVDYVLVSRSSGPQRLMSGERDFTLAGESSSELLYRRMRLALRTGPSAGRRPPAAAAR
jgi:hypothetical protein